jgi:hypothetical protein
MRNFIGQDGFVWWIGVVEDIDDPLTLGRCKVRCFGYHPAKSTNLVPTEDLPFALSIHPLNTPNLYGTPRVGEWVFGFFLDALSAQEPAILGYLPAIPQAAVEYFGTAPSLTRNFANVSNKSDILWDTNGSSIKLGSSGGINIVANNHSTITSDKTITINGAENLIFSSNSISIVANNHSTITSDKTITINGAENLIFSDSANTTTLNALLLRISTIEDILNDPTTVLRISTIEDRLNNPTTALVPNTAITVI